MVDLLTAGPGLVGVWDELDFAGVIDRLLPEWAPIRLRGSSSIIHQFTIDRHSLETCVNAAEIAREVSRPDLLAVAALLHDIGKGVPGDHSVEGEPMARPIAARWGFSAADADVIGQLVRWHLLLPDTATRRDIEDPGTATLLRKPWEASPARAVGRAHVVGRPGHQRAGVERVAPWSGRGPGGKDVRRPRRIGHDPVSR